MNKVKRGRPRKIPEDMSKEHLRFWWRKASKKYYEKNREKILEKARLKKLAEKQKLSGGEVDGFY